MLRLVHAGGSMLVHHGCGILQCMPHALHCMPHAQGGIMLCMLLAWVSACRAILVALCSARWWHCALVAGQCFVHCMLIVVRRMLLASCMHVVIWFLIVYCMPPACERLCSGRSWHCAHQHACGGRLSGFVFMAPNVAELQRG
jgi:hypothetical protein